MDWSVTPKIWYGLQLGFGAHTILGEMTDLFVNAIWPTVACTILLITCNNYDMKDGLRCNKVIMTYLMFITPHNYYLRTNVSIFYDLLNISDICMQYMTSSVNIYLFYDILWNFKLGHLNKSFAIYMWNNWTLIAI